MKEKKMSTREKIETMQAFLDGKVIEFKAKEQIYWTAVRLRKDSQDIESVSPYPMLEDQIVWDWKNISYRIREPRDLSFDWSILTDEFIYAATDKDGRSYAYRSKPNCTGDFWLEPARNGVFQICVGLNGLKSFIQTEKNWKDSLVERPKSES